MNEDRIIVQTCAEFGLNVCRSIIVRTVRVKLDLIISFEVTGDTELCVYSRF